MEPQEVADAAVRTLIEAVGQLAGPADGEIAVIVRATVDMDSTSESDLLYHWDWFWRPKAERST